MKSIVLTPAQRSIIIQIANIEIECIDEIIQTKDIDASHQIIWEAYGTDESDYFNAMLSFKNSFLELKWDPDILFEEWDPRCISIFRHIFFTIWEELRERYPNATVNLFRALEIQYDIKELERKLNMN